MVLLLILVAAPTAAAPERGPLCSESGHEAPDLETQRRRWQEENHRSESELREHRGRWLGAMSGPTGVEVEFSPDDHLLLVAGGDEVRVWDAGTFKPTACHLRLGKPVRRAGFSPDGRFVLTGAGNAARLWDVGSGREVRPFPHDGEVYAAAFSPDGKSVLTGGGDGVARLWDRDTGKLRLKLEHPPVIVFAAFSPKGDLMLTVNCSKTADPTVRVWNIPDGSRRREHSMNLADFDLDSFWQCRRPAAFSPNGTQVASVWMRGADVWSVLPDNSGKDQALCLDPWRIPGVHEGLMWTVAWSPDGGRVLTAGVVHVLSWDAKTGQLTGLRLSGVSNCRDAVFDPTGKRLLVAGGPHSLAGVWDAGTGEPILVVPDALREDEHPAAAFNRDGTRIAVAHPKDRETTVWRAERASESGAATRPAPGQIP